MAKFTVRIIIKETIDIVTEAYIKPENIPFWMNNIEKYEVVKGKAGEAGSVAQIHYHERDKKYVMENKLEYCESGKKYVSTVSSEALFVRTETTFSSANGTTKIHYTWSGRGKYFILKLLLPFMRKSIRKMAKNELIRFKNLVEIYGVDFSNSLKK
jgi:hypothetical protein